MSLKIVRVTRQQFDELWMKLIPAHRRVIQELTLSNLYVQGQNLLFVVDDDTELLNFPETEPLTISAAMNFVYRTAT